MKIELHPLKVCALWALGASPAHRPSLSMTMGLWPARPHKHNAVPKPRRQTEVPWARWLDLSALKARALSFKEGDYQVLSDRILLGALDLADGLPTASARPLRHSEIRALEDSPLTQLRLAQLNAQRRLQDQRTELAGGRAQPREPGLELR